MRATLNTQSALLGGVLAGLGASVCCIGPLLLLSLGVGGAWISHLTAMEPYRPLLIALAVVFLVLAFRRLYLRPRVCLAGETCAEDRVRGTQRILFWIVLSITIALIVSPWLLTLFYR
jgi:mercuric ion transport protein